MSVEVGVGVNVAVGVKLAVGVKVKDGVMDGVSVAGGTPLRTMRGPTHRASSSLADPLVDTNKINLTVCPASELRSKSMVKYWPS